jgi:prevent-host-death family protein
MSSSTQIPRSITAAEARSNLGQIIRRASGKKKERFVIGLRGGPKAILMGLEDYLDSIAPLNPLMAEMHAISIANGTDKMPMEEIDAEIAACRAEQSALDAELVCRS